MRGEVEGKKNKKELRDICIANKIWVVEF